MQYKQPLKLHLGCADQKLEGWINIDGASEFNADLIHDLAQPLPYQDQIVEEIMAKDLLEHFDKYQRYLVFYDWARVLKIGGEITLEVPNFKKILYKYFKFGFDNFVDFIFGENMIRSKYYVGHYGNHKFAYSEKTLQDFVSLFGIEPIAMEKKGLNLIYKGRKQRHVSFEDIKDIKVHSHANSFGDTPDLTLDFIRDRINHFEKSNGKKYWKVKE